MAASLEDAVRRFPINAWLSGHTRVRDGGGRNLYADCTACQGKEKIRYRKETGRWTCFKCDAGGYAGDAWRGWGDLFALVAYFEKISYGQAVRFVADRAGIPDLDFKRPEIPRNKIPEEAIPLAEIPADHISHRRLAKRGLAHLAPKLYGCVSGQYAGRWILPCKFGKELQGFEAKAWHPKTQPKALYPTWFVARESVYTTYNWDDSLGFAIVTESVFDAETFGLNAVGIYGANLLPGQFDKLLTLRERGITALYWALDPDAFDKAAKGILSKTFSMFSNHLVEIPKLLPDGSKGDPNAIGTDACWELVESAVLVESEWDLLARLAEDL